MIEDLQRAVPRRYPLRRGAFRIRNALGRMLIGDGRNSHVESVNFRFLPHHQKFYFGLYERHVVDLMRSWLRSGDCMIDVGANAGYLSAVALDCVGRRGRVLEFEAAPAHHEELAWLVRLNPGWNVTGEHCAVGAHDGTIELFLSSNRGWHSTVPGFDLTGTPPLGSVQVPVVRLDTVARRHDLLRPGAIRLIKVDVEGAELAVVSGARELIATRAVDAFVIEVTPPGPLRPVPPVGELFASLQSAGYRAFRVDTRVPVSSVDFLHQADVLFLAPGLTLP